MKPTIRHRAPVLLVLGLTMLLVLGPVSAGTASHRGRVAPSASPNPAAGSWTTYLGSNGRTSDNPNETAISPLTAPSLQLAWNFSTGGPIASEPIVTSNNVFFGSWDGNEYDVHLGNGSLVWKTYLGQSQCSANSTLQGVTSTATVTNGTLYVGGGGEYWYALNQFTGAPKWSIYTGNNSPTLSGGHYNWASPLIYRGSAYIGLASDCDMPLIQGGVLMVNLTSHQVVHRFNTTNLSTPGASVWGSPTADPVANVVLFATGNLYFRTHNMSWFDDSVIEVNASTLGLVSHYHIPTSLQVADSDFGSTPTLFHTWQGFLRTGVANKDGYFFAFDRYKLSTPLWKVRVSENPTFSPAAFDGRSLYLGSGAGVLPNNKSERGALWSLNASTGHPNWAVAMPGNVYGAPVVANGVVAAAGGNLLIVVNASNGVPLFKFRAPAGDKFLGGPTISHGRLIIGNTNGELYVFVPGNNSTSGGPIVPVPGFSVTSLPAHGPAAACPKPFSRFPDPQGLRAAPVRGHFGFG